MRTRTRSINRFAQMLRFFSVSRLLLWTLWVIYRERKRVIDARSRGNFEVQPNVEVLIDVLVEFRKTAVKLGVLMIKLGQFLSTRADLLPERALSVLTSLQDEVPPEPFDHVKEVIEDAYGKPISEMFSMIEQKSTAAASLGQVHKATLASTGETVAVKVQRPHIDQLVAMDLSSLRFVIWVITKFIDTSFIDLWGVYREFRRTVYEEIDFITEAANAQRFKEMFKDDPTIYIPTIYDQYITRRVLVLEWIDGIKVNDYAALDAIGYDHLKIATRTVKAYFHQFFEIGFFHADPHPGNIFVKQGSAPDDPVIAFLDFGMVGSLTRNAKRSFRDMFLSVVSRDARLMVNALNNLGFIGEGANMQAIERAIGILIDQYYGVSLGQARNLDMRDIMQDVVQLLYGQPFFIPAQFAFSGRAVSTLVGVATGLAPDFNFVEVATPYARDFLGLGGEGIRETVQEVLQQVLENGRLLLTLPRSVDRLISQIETGQLEVKLANVPSVPTRPTRGRGRGRRNTRSQAGGTTSSSLSWVLLSAVTMVGGIFLLVSAHLIVPGWFLLGLTGLSGLRLILRG